MKTQTSPSPQDDLMRYFKLQDLENACKIDQIFTDADIDQLGKKGVTNITLLNTVSVVKQDGTTDSNVIMDVMLGLILEEKSNRDQI